MPGITLDQLKAHLNVTFDADDALLAGKLATAKSFVSGFIEADIDVDGEDTPGPVNEAVLKVAAWLYQNREASLQAMPDDWLEFLGKYRAWVFG